MCAGDAWIEKLTIFISRRCDSLIRCLPKMSLSSSTSTGSQIATWTRWLWQFVAKWSTFGSDPDLRVDFRSLFHFLHHCGIGNFWAFISLSHTVNGQFVLCLAKWLTPTFWDRSGPGLFQNPDSNPISLLFQNLALAEICALWVLLLRFVFSPVCYDICYDAMIFVTTEHCHGETDNNIK